MFNPLAGLNLRTLVRNKTYRVVRKSWWGYWAIFKCLMSWLSWEDDRRHQDQWNMCFLLKHNIRDRIVHLDIDHYIDGIKSIHRTVLVKWLVTGFWFLEMHYVTACDVRRPLDVTLWCHMMSHHRQNVIHRNGWCYMWFTNTPESVPARSKKRSSSSS